MKINHNGWNSAPVNQLFYVKGRIGWRGLKRSMFTDHGPYLITGMHIIDGKVQWDECFHIPEHKYLESPEIMVQEGDMVITKDGTIGKVGFIDWLPGPTSLNSHLFLVRPKVEDVDRRFAYHVFTSQLFEDFIEQQRSGSTLSGLSEAKFLKFDFPLPEIDEQERIAKLLDTAVSAIQQTEQLIAKLKQVKAGLLHDLLTRGLDEHGNLRDPEAHPEQFKVDGYGRVPKDWEFVQIKDIAVQVTDGDHHTPQRSESGILLLSARNVLNGVLDLTDVDYVPKSEYLRMIKRCHPEAGDILISCSGTVGRVCAVPEGLRFALVHPGIKGSLVV